MGRFLLLGVLFAGTAQAVDTGDNCFAAALRKLKFLDERRYVSPAEFERVLKLRDFCHEVSRPNDADVTWASAQGRQIVGVVYSAQGQLAEHAFVSVSGSEAMEKHDNLPTSTEAIVKTSTILKERRATKNCAKPGRALVCHRFLSCRTKLTKDEAGALKRVFREEAPRSREEYKAPHGILQGGDYEN